MEVPDLFHGGTCTGHGSDLMSEDMTPISTMNCPYCGRMNYNRLEYSDCEEDEKRVMARCHCHNCGNDFTEYFEFSLIVKGLPEEWR